MRAASAESFPERSRHALGIKVPGAPVERRAAVFVGLPQDADDELNMVTEALDQVSDPLQLQPVLVMCRASQEAFTRNRAVRRPLALLCLRWQHGAHRSACPRRPAAPHICSRPLGQPPHPNKSAGVCAPRCARDCTASFCASLQVAAAPPAAEVRPACLFAPLTRGQSRLPETAPRDSARDCVRDCAQDCV